MTTEDLIRLYNESWLALVQIVALITRENATKREIDAAIIATNTIISKLQKANRSWADSAIISAFDKQAEIIKSSLVQLTVSFGTINENPINLLRSIALESLDNAVVNIGRQISDDVLRSKGLLYTLNKFETNQTIKEMAREFAKSLVDGNSIGFGRVQVSNTRTMRIDSYAELVSRSTTREATNLATILQGQEMGYGLVRMSEHFPTCDICSPIQGRIYRTIDFPYGDYRQQFPHISQAMPGYPTYYNVHPNCKHVFTNVADSLWSDEERKRYLLETTVPLNVDTQSKQQQVAYAKAQEQNRKRLADRYQFERYTLVMNGHPDMPKSFSGFRAMKHSSSERYQRLKSEYASIMRSQSG